MAVVNGALSFKILKYLLHSFNIWDTFPVAQKRCSITYERKSRAYTFFVPSHVQCELISVNDDCLYKLKYQVIRRMCNKWFHYYITANNTQ